MAKIDSILKPATISYDDYDITFDHALKAKSGPSAKIVIEAKVLEKKVRLLCVTCNMQHDALTFFNRSWIGKARRTSSRLLIVKSLTTKKQNEEKMWQRFKDSKCKADTTWQQSDEWSDWSLERVVEMPYTRWKMWKWTLLCSGEHWWSLSAGILWVRELGCWN